MDPKKWNETESVSVHHSKNEPIPSNGLKCHYCKTPNPTYYGGWHYVTHKDEYAQDLYWDDEDDYPWGASIVYYCSKDCKDNISYNKKCLLL